MQEAVHKMPSCIAKQGQIPNGAVLDNPQARQWILEGFGAQSWTNRVELF